MLTSLQIRNFAIIDEQTIEFGPGLNVLTGETGAGKSIVLQALQLILGARASSNLTRKGADGWHVSAVFELESAPSSLLEALPEIAQTPELVLTRSVDKKGKSRAYVNGNLVTVSVLQSISQSLLSICGQNQQSLLLDSDYHRELLDDFAGNNKLLESYQEVFTKWKALNDEVKNIEAKRSADALRRAELSFIIEEMKQVNPTPTLRSELEELVKKASKSEEAVILSNSILDKIQASEGVGVAIEVVRRSVEKLSSLVEVPHGLMNNLNVIEEAVSEIESALSKVVDSIDIDEAELDSKRDILAEVARLERKYKTDSDGLCSLYETACKELALLEDDAKVDELKTQLEGLALEAQNLASRLTNSRNKAFGKLAKEVKANLAELNMPNTSLELKFDQGDLGPTGVDKIEFLLSANKGEDPKPLRMIASGGELSRITLVLKKLLRDRKGVNILVFDEVDTGISGSVARSVGVKLKELAAHSQVLCITHLAQVASLSDTHILVEKKVGKRTLTILRELSNEERLEEVARMLAGYEVTDASRESAKELLAS